jgi:rubrerythrin
MDDPSQDHPSDREGRAYERMLQRAMDELHRAGQKTGPALHRFIDSAKDRAIELEELSRDEAERIAAYLKRDLIDAAEFSAESGEELKDWLGFEVQLIEDRLLDLFMRASDKTTVELLELKENARRASTYHAGEVTGPGTLICDACGTPQHFHKPRRISPCPNCHATEFQRLKR